MDVFKMPRADIASWQRFAAEAFPSRESEAAVARAVVVHPDTVKSWKAGKAAARPKLYPAIARHLGLSEAAIFKSAGLPFDSLASYRHYCEDGARLWRNAYAVKTKKRPALHELTQRGQKFRRMRALSEEDRSIAAHLRADGAPYSVVDLVDIVRAWDCRCAYCGTSLTFTGEITREHVTTDHIVPVSDGGPDALSNLVPACYSCNSSKSDRDLLTWADRRGLVLPQKVVDQYNQLMAIP